MIKFTIPLTPITKKNHQQILKNSKTGKPFVAPSTQYKQYTKDCGWFIPSVPAPIDYPCEVKCLFYMPTKRRVDLTNLLESIDDIMVDCGLLADDDSKVIVSHDGSRVLYDKVNPRTEVEIRRINNDNT